MIYKYAKQINWDTPLCFNSRRKGIDNMNFGQAIEALKGGLKVARKGWNGKGMFIYLVKGRLVQYDEFRNEALEAVKLAYKLEGNIDNNPSARIVNSHIDMKTADGSLTIGWAPSQLDMLAEDWHTVE